ncbi:hypothetical protein BDM02DRAFT_1809806 [Thelephora ganbajun]|uniref:Uncharacterized protein n=1 Tax=Thelephora ganbajun TaxID=370292 RepID=A0ACB6ZJF2_THEGA|nr:hypothetical protein BDM02DRAFT_1809806 [Thelephora ganbajun]
MSELSPDEQKEQGPDVDWAALKIAIDEIVAALALFTGNFDSSDGDDTALLYDINSRAQGLRQAVSKDEKHTLSPEAIVRALVAVQFDLRHLPHHETEHGVKIKSICKVCRFDPSRMFV